MGAEEEGKGRIVPLNTEGKGREFLPSMGLLQLLWLSVQDGNSPKDRLSM